MSNCRTCGGGIDWGFDEETKKFVPLEPIATQGDLPRTHVDINGELRADHRERHGGSATVTVSRLRRPVPAEMAEGNKEAIVSSARKRSTRQKVENGEEATKAKHSRNPNLDTHP